MKGLKGFTSMSTNSNTKKSLYGDARLFSFADYPNEKLKFRLIGIIRGYSTHWIKIKTNQGKEVSVPKMCLNYNADTDTFEENKCPYCGLSEDKAGRKYLVNAIFRQEQEKEPKEVSRTSKEDKEVTLFEDWNCKVKDPNSKSWTPVVCLSLPRGVATELEAISRDNTNKHGEQRDITDPISGIDIYITYRPEKAGEAKYKVEKGDKSKLSEEEKDYLVWDIDNIPVETLAEAKEEAKKLEAKIVNKKTTKTLSYEDDEEDDKPVKKVKSISFDDDDEDDEKPVKKKSTKSFDEDDEDEDEKPVKKKVSKSFDDDEESEEDDDDDFE